MVALATSPADVFFSYSPRDEDLRPKLETHLDALKRQGVIRTYQGFALGGGKERREVIAARLREARVVLLLVSADFLSADGWLTLRFGAADLGRRTAVIDRVAGALRSRGASW